ncbi:hypothetical protein AALP_AA1G016300 [Arabis alpina]|uniref:Uncharacterized protein n=1 Tax=Arabis alpina TaxID=50452 RepID=A0A087HKE6_ARAAL|nr:hypothetical protein AALP_AA1G016300 [Arabis alpina]
MRVFYLGQGAKGDLRSKTHVEADDDAVNKAMESLQNDMEVLVKSAGKKKKKKIVEAIHDECCYDDKDWKGNNEKTLFVQGFETSLPRNEISSCGEIKRVFVPIECKTGVALGPESSIDDLEGCARCVLNTPFCCNQPTGGMDLEKDMEIFMNWDEAA